MLVRATQRQAACGLVGYPNVGKSTVFNALAGSALAEAANYPFCTIDPNVTKISVKDDLLDRLAKMKGSKKTIYDQIEIRDIAGLIKGASQGEGMGNAFLSHIRSGTNVIIQVVRCFENDTITSVLANYSKPDPVREFTDIQEELIIADMEFASKRVRAMKNSTIPAQVVSLAEQVLTQLETGRRAKPVIDKLLDESHPDFLKFTSQLITGKPLVILANADSESQAACIREHISRLDENVRYVWMNAAVEAEAAAMTAQGEDAFAAEWLPEPRIAQLTAACKNALGLSVFYTLGIEEARSWLFRSGAKMPQAGGSIHTDFDKYFSRAEVTKVEDLFKHGVHACKVIKGKDYVVPDCEDVIEFKIRK